MKRRTFISALAGGVMTGSQVRAQLKPNPRRKRGSLKKLVVIFQRGGNDGLNMLVPVDSTEHNLYRNLRPDIYVPSASAINIPNSSFFGLHPAMTTLQPALAAGNLSLLHAVGYPSPDRSHFESQSYYETAVPGNGLLDGWINRFLQNTTGSGLIRGISIGYNIPQSVTGSIAVPVSNNFGTLDVNVDYQLDDTPAANYRQAIRDAYNQTATTGNESVYATGNKIFQMVDSFADRDANNYTPDNGATYPDNSLGRKMLHTAQMLKDDTSFLGIEVITVDQGGYDTHANQVNSGNTLDTATGQPRLLRELAESMSAFYQDMGSTRMDDVIVLVVSEFGRRAYQNDSMGTDHGTGNAVLVMGNGVNGNVVGGGSDWPGLDNLYRNDDLMWVTDFRDIYWEILSTHMGLDTATLNTIIPGHTHSPLGFMS